MIRAVVRSLLLILFSALASCASARPFDVPRQEIPAARFEPVTEGQDSSGLQRVNAERLAVAKARFRDLDPKGWQGSGPWWLRYGARLVPYVDGQTVLVAIGEAPAASNGAGQVSGAFGGSGAAGAVDGELAVRRAAAAERAREGAERAFQALLGKVAHSRARALPPEGPRLRRVSIDAFFEHGGRTWALALCDRDCLEASGRAARVNLSGVPLQPGEP